MSNMRSKVHIILQSSVMDKNKAFVLFEIPAVRPVYSRHSIINPQPSTLHCTAIT